MRTPKQLAALAMLAVAWQPCHAQESAAKLPTTKAPLQKQQAEQGLPRRPAEAIPAPAVVPDGPSRVRLRAEDYNGDWRQAGDGEGGLGNRLRSHVVRTAEDGLVRGKIATIESATGDLNPLKDVKIRFIRKGEQIAETKPSPDGSFSVRNLEPGVYSMVAAGPGGFIAWSVNVQPKRSAVAKMPKYKQAKFLKQEVQSSIDIEAAAVAPENFVPLKRLLRSYLPSEASTLYIDGDDIPDGMEDEPPADARLGTSIRHHQIRLAADGKLRGRVRRLQPDSGRDLKIRQLNVFMLRNNQTVDQVEVAPNGTFVFNDLRPGVYSMVAAGQDGFLAFSVDVLNPEKSEVNVPRETEVRTASIRIDDGAQFQLAIDVALCSPEDLNAANIDRMTDNFPRDNGAPIADAGAASPAASGAMPGLPGGALGPVGGGGGIPPSGPGLGSILTSTAVGVGVSSLVADDDDSRQQSSPSSPSGGTGQ